MQRLKEYYNAHKATIMIVPRSDKSIKQIKFNIAAAFIILVTLIIANVGLLMHTVTKNYEANQLQGENRDLAASLQLTEDRILSLQSINNSRFEEITKLKESLSASSIYLQNRLDEMDQAQAYIGEIIALFNTETNSNLSLPISRSFSRTLIETPETAVSSDVEDANLIFYEIEDLVQNDEIGQVIMEQAEAYHTLVSELETRLNYLDRRPDFFPATGTLTSSFGYRRDPFTGRSSMHNGIDIANSSGTKIYAAGAGVVTFARYSGSYGNLIIIDHGNGYESVYAHCRTLLVSAGDSVEKMQNIATMGATGLSTGTHLHFEIRFNGSPINPYNILNTND